MWGPTASVRARVHTLALTGAVTRRWRSRGPRRAGGSLLSCAATWRPLSRSWRRTRRGLCVRTHRSGWTAVPAHSTVAHPQQSDIATVAERVVLDLESRQRIIDWLDLNAPFYGTYSWNKDEWRRPHPQGEAALRAHIRQRFGDELAGQPFAALVNVALPDESRILKAPLAIAAGGWGQIEQGGWKNSDDPDCQKLRGLVQAAIQPLPHHDIAGTCGRAEDCLCSSCWVRAMTVERQRQIAAGKSRADRP